MDNYDAGERNRYGSTTIADQATAFLGNRYGDVFHIQQVNFLLASAPITNNDSGQRKVVRHNRVIPSSGYTLETIKTFEDGTNPFRRGTSRQIELKWIKCEDLGAGAFGEVHREEHREGNDVKSRAVKVLRRRQLDRMGIDYKKELDALIQLSKPDYIHRFIEFYSWYEDETYIYLAMEYIPYGDLESYIKPGLMETDIKQITYQVLDGIRVMHRLSLIHRDIKPANIFVLQREPIWWVKIGDFSICKSTIARGTSYYTQVGTQGYQAPEILGLVTGQHRQHSAKCDLWSFGCLVFEMLTLRLPFTDIGALAKYCNGESTLPMTPVKDAGRSQLSGEFVRTLLQAEPKSRPTAEEAAFLLTYMCEATPASHLSAGGKEHVHFRDCIGRHFSLPWGICSTWEDMLVVIRLALSYIESVRPQVINGDYDILDTDQQVIEPRQWEDKVQPGTQIAMVLWSSNDSVSHTGGGSLVGSKGQQMQRPSLIPVLESEVAVALPYIHSGSRYQTSSTTSNAAGQTDLCSTVSPSVVHFKPVEISNAVDSAGDVAQANARRRQTLAIQEQRLGEDQPDTLTDIANLASTYRNQGKWKEAEGLGMAVMTTRKRVLGEEHPSTLDSMASLVLTYLNQARWKEAEELGMAVMTARKRVLGEEHPDTLSSMANLASTYRKQGRLQKAEEMGMVVMKTMKSVSGEEHPDTISSMAILASTYQYQGRSKEAEELGMAVVKMRKRVLGEEHPETLTSMTDLAVTYKDQGRWEEAEELGMAVVKTMKRVLGEEHPDTLVSISNLAWIYLNHGRWREAEEMGITAAKAMKRVLGEEHPDTLTSIAILVWIYHNQGRWREAEEVGVTVMKTMERVLGEEHPHTLSSMANLASTYRNQERLQEAEEMGLAVMKTMKRVLGEEHPHTLITMANLASTYRSQGRLQEAEEMGVALTKTMKRVLGDEHPHTLTSIVNLALTYWNQERLQEAEEMGAAVMKTTKRVLGREHLLTLLNMDVLIWTYLRQRRWKEAEELGTVVVKIRKRVLGEEHPTTLTSMANLAWTYEKQGRWKEAEELEMAVVKIRKRVLGEEHPDTLTSMADLVVMYENQGRSREAEQMGIAVMKTMKRVLGEEHPDTLNSMVSLAVIYWNQGRWKEAEGLELELVKTRKRVLGEEHPDTLSSMANLASAYREQERLQEAEEMGLAVVKIRKRVLGEGHPDTLSSMADLVSIYQKQGRWQKWKELEMEMKTSKTVLGDEYSTIETGNRRMKPSTAKNPKTPYLVDKPARSWNSIFSGKFRPRRK